MTIDELLSQLGGMKRTTRGYHAHCPAHEKRGTALAGDLTGAVARGPGCGAMTTRARVSMSTWANPRSHMGDALGGMNIFADFPKLVPKKF